MVPLLLLAACQAADGVTRYQCGPYRVEVDYKNYIGSVEGKKGQVIPLAYVPSAPEARFEGKPDIVLRDKEGAVTLSVGKEEIACEDTQQRLMLEALARKQQEQERLEIYRMQNQVNAALPKR